MAPTLHEEHAPMGMHPYPPTPVGTIALAHLGEYPYSEQPVPSEFEVRTKPHLTDLSSGLESSARALRVTTGRSTDWLEHLDPACGDTLAEGNYTSGDLREFMRSALDWQSAVVNRHHQNGNSRPGDYMPILRAVKRVPIDTLFVAYHSDDHGGRELHTMLERAIAGGNVREPLNFYKKLYGCGRTLDLSAPSSPAQRDPIVRKLFEKEETVFELVRTLRQETVPDNIAHQNPESKRAANAALRGWENDFLRSVTGLPENLSTELQVATHERMIDQNTGVIDKHKLASHLLQTWRRVNQLGVDKAVELRKSAGIVNFDARSPEQIELMSRLINGDNETIEHLQLGDVTVVFTDEFGDYNGSVQDTIRNFDTQSGRTLSFGVTQPSDIYRHMSLLKRLGVKPSSLVFAAHGMPGGLHFGDASSGFTITSTMLPAYTRPENVPKDKIYLPLAEGLPRLIDEFMQDSRGIDDNPEAKGRRRVLITSCYQAAPAGSLRYTVKRPSDGNRDVVLLPYLSDDSTAETLVRAAKNPKLDVIAGDTMQGTRRTRHGIDFWQYETPNSKVPVPMKATRYYLYDSEGRVMAADLDEVRWRAEPDKRIQEHVPRFAA